MIDTIVNGNAYELVKRIPDKSVDLIYTDIPYLGGISKQDDPFDSFENIMKANRFYDGIDLSIIEDFFRIIKKTNIYIWCSQNQIKPILDCVMDKYGGGDIQMKLLVWHKTNVARMNRHQYLTDLEYCLYFTQGQGIKDTGHFMSRIYVSPTNIKENKEYGHCTTKPYEMVRNHILASSNKGDLVLDPFSGSGTTCMVCKNEARHYLGFEIDKGYYQHSIDRLNGLSIDDKNKIDSGEMPLFQII